MKNKLISYVVMFCCFWMGFGGAYLYHKQHPKTVWTQSTFEDAMRAKFQKLKEERQFRIDQ